MYFKKEYIPKEQKDSFLEHYHAEFAWSYYHKVKNIEKVELGMVVFEYAGKTYEKAVIKQKVINVLNHTFDDRFVDISGIKSKLTTTGLLNPEYRLSEKDFLNVQFLSLDENQFKEKFSNMNDKKTKEASELVSNFCNLKAEGIIQSKTNDTFTYKIIENSDVTLGSLLLLDELRLYKNDIQIGFLKTKYTTDEIITNLLLSTGHLGLNEKISNDEKREYLEDYNIEHNESNYELVFKLHKLKHKEEFNKIKKELIVFNDIATIDYSKLHDDYRGLGIGTQMYLKMAEHYHSKNIAFRSSSAQSPSAKALWEKIKREYPSQIEEISIDNRSYYQLKGNGDKNKITKKTKNKKTLQ